MKEYLTSQQDQMLKLLEKLVNVDSGSYNKEGVDQVASMLKDEFEREPFHVEVRDIQDYGNQLIVTHKEAQKPSILLVLHMDTVFPKGTASERPFNIKEGVAYGPGVVDMKGSHVTTLFALKALANESSEAIKAVKILFTSDEEIGAPVGRDFIEEQAEGMDYALVMEPARTDGSLVSSRRGGGKYILTVKGIAAHSGIEPEKGRSAIEELSHKVIALHQLSDHDKGISVNVGLIEGGSAVNTVADSARAEIDIRISQMEQAHTLDQSIKEICSKATVEGTTIQLEGGIERPPMEKNEQTIELLQTIQAVGEEIGLSITDISTGGGSDASFTSAMGIATVDGLGPKGGKQHNEGEYLEIDTLVERAELLASVIERLAK
ncbi:M20 family metallopeptidase [Alkalicoccobacillus porphyridii]|uniref:M20 family metallopeptidase n=1 Tax=Alkalicoccobacillus porphyridii TaxID=2597270 RepID=A0A554A3Y7_9BACI|nr:M20 family metallopeptidase [Alkalicoccobacillus porphyridii]TSB48403.1 M20 family metallopeptidase [Alkalicoccobacillus porphyridii]